MSEKPRLEYGTGPEAGEIRGLDFPPNGILESGSVRYRIPDECLAWRGFRVILSKGATPYLLRADGEGRADLIPLPRLRDYTEEPVGPLEMLVMAWARELHDREHVDCDWFDHVGSTVGSFCRRAVELRGIEWPWIQEALKRERHDERTDVR